MAEFKHKIGCLVRLHGHNNAAYNLRLGKVMNVLELNTTGRLTVELQEIVRHLFSKKLRSSRKTC